MFGTKRKNIHQIDYNPILKERFDEQKYCDVIFSCKTPENEWKSIGAHKIVLVSVSDVFETMFHGAPLQHGAVIDKKEIKIDDISYETFTQFLKFIYGTQMDVDDFKEISGFAYAAHKYNCIDAMTFVTKFITKTLDSFNVIFFYEIAIMYDIEESKEICIKKFKENISAVLSSSQFLTAKSDIVNTIFGLNSALSSEMDYVWALERYFHHNEKTDPEIAAKLRPALNEIRFLTLREPEIRATSLLTDQEKEILIECLPVDADLSKIPENLSTSRKERNCKLMFDEEDVKIVKYLSKFMMESQCQYCINNCFRQPQHAPWYCCKMWPSKKKKIQEIYFEYDHTNLIFYDREDLKKLYELFQHIDEESDEDME